MEYIDHKITLDVHDTVAPVSLSLKRRETGHRLLIRLADKGYPYHISDDCYAVFTAKKADGEVIFNNCTIEDCVIAYEITEQTVAVTGLLNCEIQLYGADSKLLMSPNFYIVIVDTLYDEQDTLESTTEYLALTQLISQVIAIIQNIGGFKVVTKTSELINDSGFITNAVSDLVNYYAKSETYSRTEIHNLISSIPKFSIAVVPALPTDEISDTTIYLVPGGEGSDLYTEYLRVNDKWEILGSQRVDLSGYATEQWVKKEYQPKGDYLTEHQDISGKLDADKLPEAINDALVQAKESGEFDGQDGDDYVLTEADKNEIAKMAADLVDVPGSGGNAENGEDGFSPIATVTQTETGAVISITDANGTTTATIINGKDGTDGQPGKDGSAGKDGTSVTVTNVTESTVDGGSNVVTFSDGKTLIVKNGKTGAAGKDGSDASVTTANIQTALGYTPVNPSKLTLGIHTDGLMYLFVDGKPVGAGIELSAAGDVVGYVDENNNIIVSGNLADGSYTVKYEMEDGSTVNIGNLVLDSNVYYSVTNTLTNCTNSNSATEVIGGESYSAVISANSGYELSSVTVTNGGESVTVNDGVIEIAEVKGDIVITAIAEEVQVAEPVTENIALTDGIRIGSDGTDRTQAGYCATPHIDLTNIPKPCIIKLTNAFWCDASKTSGMVRVYAKQADGTTLVADITSAGVGGDYFTVVDNSGGTGNDVTVTVTSDDVGYIRFSGWWAKSGVSGSDSVFANAGTKATLTYTPAS